MSEAAAPGTSRLEPTLRLVAIVVVTAVVMFPVYWMVLSAIRPSDQSLSFPPPLLPHGLDLSSFAQLFGEKPIAHWLLLSTFVAGLTVIGTLLLVIPAAYALSRLYWAGRSAFGLLLLFTQMMPGAVVVAPVLMLYRSLGWTDNLWALALLHTAFVVPLCAWVLKTSFDAVRVRLQGELRQLRFRQGGEVLSQPFHCHVPPAVSRAACAPG